MSNDAPSRELDEIPVMAWSLRPDGVVDYLNRRWIEYTGLSLDQFSANPTAILHPDDGPRVMDQWRSRIAEGHAYDNELRLRRADGEYRWFLARTSPVRDDLGNIVKWYGVSTDIEDRKSAEDAVRERQRLLQQVLDALPIGVLVTDRRGNILINNPVAGSIWGGVIVPGAERYARSRARWHGTDKTLAPSDWPSVRAATEGQVSMNVLLDIETYEGQTKTTQNSAAPIRDSAGEILGAVVVIEDVTERQRLEDHYRQAQKMEAVGKLAAGVAHDFNNLLMIISGHSEVILSDLEHADPNREMIAEIQVASERAATLTRQLLTFSRKTVLAPKVIDVNEVVRESEKMLRRLIGEDITLATALDSALGHISADPAQLSQVIVNLVVNARDAMATGGDVTIKTANAALDDEHVTIAPEAKPGRYIILSVADTGGGIPPDVLAHIFEPFFTTKHPGMGTGLGLASVYGIVKQSGGFIRVHSELNRGTTFRLYFPVAEGRPVPQMSSAPEVLAHGTETILLVEDEEAVRSLMKSVLQQAGYTVIDAGRGSAALQLADEHAAPIHLLIADVVMPEMGGRELAERLTRDRPGTKVLYLSGYTDDAVLRHGVLKAEVAFLQKPFTMAALTNKVREVLDETKMH